MVEFVMVENFNGKNWEWSLSHKKKLKKLLLTGFQSDLTLLLGPDKEEIKVHKLLFQMGSKTLFSSILKCSDPNILELPDVEPYVFKQLLKFLYTGTSGVKMLEALPLLKLANECEIVKLKDECNTALKETLTNQTVFPLLQIAMEYGRKDLIKTVLKYISRNAGKLFELEEFFSLRLECLVEVLQQDDLWIRDEIEVFHAVYKWGIAECKRQNVDETDAITLQKILSKPLNYVRFPLMDKRKFALNVATKSVLSKDEILAIYSRFLVKKTKRSALPSCGRFSCTPRSFLPQYFMVFRKMGSNSLKPYNGVYNMITETISFTLHTKFCVKLTEILFDKMCLNGFTYEENCGYTHSPVVKKVSVKCTVETISEPSDSEGESDSENNSEDVDEDSDEDSEEEEDDEVVAFDEEGKLIIGEKPDDFSFKLESEYKFLPEKFYTLKVKFEGRSRCAGDFRIIDFFGGFNCHYSRFFKLGMRKVEENGFTVSAWNEQEKVSEDDGATFPLRFEQDDESPQGLIKGFEFQLV